MRQNELLIHKLSGLFFKWVDESLLNYKRVSARNYFEFSQLDELSDLELIQLHSITREEVAYMITKINERFVREYPQGSVKNYHGFKGIIICEEIRTT